MNRDETLRAAETLSASPAATWIGNRFSEDGTQLIQRCLRCGSEETLPFPAAPIEAFRGGARGAAVASLVPSGFDEQLFAWKRAFQIAHEGCCAHETGLK